MYLPMTRWQRPRCAHAGAKRGSSSRQRWYRSRACGEAVVGARQLVARAGRARRRGRCAARRAWATPSARQRQRQRLHHAPGDVVLQPEQIAERRLDRVRREQRPARRLDQLRRGPQLVAGAQQRAHHHAIDVGLGRQRLEVRRLAGEARGGGARAHDQRADARQRGRDRVRQAEGEEVGLRIGPQDAERQHDQPRQRARQRRRVVAVDAANGAQLLGHRVGRRRPLRRAAWPARGGSRGRPRPRPASRSAPAAARAAWRAGSRRRCGRRTPGGPASISNRIAPAANRSLRASTASPVTCSGAM